MAYTVPQGGFGHQRSTMQSFDRLNAALDKHKGLRRADDYNKELAGLGGGTPIDLEAQRMAVGGTPNINPTGGQFGSLSGASPEQIFAIQQKYPELGKNLGKQYEFMQKQQLAQQERVLKQNIGQVISGDMKVEDFMKQDPSGWGELQNALSANNKFQNQAISQIGARVEFMTGNGNYEGAKKLLEEELPRFKDSPFATQVFSKQIKDLSDETQREKVNTSAKNLRAMADPDYSKKLADMQSTEATTKLAEKTSELREKEISNYEKEYDLKVKAQGLRADEVATEKAALIMEQKKMDYEQRKVPPTLQKAGLDATSEALAQGTSAKQSLKLAEDLEAAKGKMPSGINYTLGAFVREVFGNEDEYDLLRKRYSGQIATGVVALLPSGPASDKDIEMAKGAFPAKSGNPEHLASFLRGRAKIARYAEIMEEAKSSWITTFYDTAKARDKGHENDILGRKITDEKMSLNKFLEENIQKIYREKYGASSGEKGAIPSFLNKYTKTP